MKTVKNTFPWWLRIDARDSKKWEIFHCNGAINVNMIKRVMGLKTKIKTRLRGSWG